MFAAISFCKFMALAKLAKLMAREINEVTVLINLGNHLQSFGSQSLYHEDLVGQ